MNQTKIILFLITFLSMLSCTEEFDLNVVPQESCLVVDAMITNGKPPYYVRLTLSKDVNNKTFDLTNSGGNIEKNSFQGVMDAQIYITDNKGNIDTLVSDFIDSYSIIRNATMGFGDTIFYIDSTRARDGYYRTQNLQGVANREYELSVTWQGQEFTSSCTMPQCPLIDSVSYTYTNGAEGKPNYYIPHIWFKDNPNTEDYYLFKTSGFGGVWSRSILSDEFINDDITGLNVFQGESHDWWRNGYPMPGYYSSYYYTIEMYSITKEVYQYYEALIGQYRSDGGIYTPTPASPPSNISGYSQGYFSTSGFQSIRAIMPHPNY